MNKLNACSRLRNQSVREQSVGLKLFLLALVVTFLLYAPRPVAAGKWYCDCNNTADCDKIASIHDWYCQWLWCYNDPSTPDYEDVCFLNNNPLSVLFGSHFPDASDAVGLWLLAYETAGADGGGTPDADLVAAAQSVPLSECQHQAIRLIVFNTLALYLGTVDDDGPWTPPDIPPDFESICDLPIDDNGSVDELDVTHLGVGALVRQAITGEFLTPGEGVFEGFMELIPIQFPAYEPVGRCESIDPPGSGGAVYGNGIECLTGELRGMLDSHLATCTEGIAVFQLDPAYIYYKFAFDSMFTSVYVGNFAEEHSADEVTSIAINGVSASLISVLPDYPGFEGEVWELEIPIAPFLDEYGAPLDTTNFHFMASLAFTDTTSSTAVGDIDLIGKSSASGGKEWILPPDVVLLHGDVDASGEIDIDDVVRTISVIFSGGSVAGPFMIADCNCSHSVDIDDAVYLINYIFTSGPFPCHD